MVRVFADAESHTHQVKAFHLATGFESYLHHYYAHNPWTSTLTIPTEMDSLQPLLWQTSIVGAKYVYSSSGELKVTNQDVHSVTGKDVF